MQRRRSGSGRSPTGPRARRRTVRYCALNSPEPLAEQIAYEQIRVDAFYAYLDARAQRRREAAELNRKPLDRDSSPQEVFERDAAEHHFVQSQAEWEALDDFLVIGRLDLADGTTHYIGKAAADPENGSVLLDWRAPAATEFFTSTAAQSGNIVRRRSMTVVHRRVRALRDEVFDASQIDWSTVVHCDTEDLLRATVDSGSPRMAGVLATMSTEQHEALHLPARALLLLGGPGTGKTAIAQHRVSLQAFGRRSKGLRSRILIVSPTRRLAAFAESLLPMLGEHDVTSLVFEDPTVKLPGNDAAGVLEEPAQVSQAVARALRELRPPIREDLRIVIRGEVVSLRTRHLEQLRREVVATSRSQTEAHDLYPAWVAEHLTRLWFRARRDKGEWIPPRERRATFRDAYADPRLRSHARKACPLIDTQMILDHLTAPTQRSALGHPWAITVTGLQAEIAHVLERDHPDEDLDHDIVLVDEAQELTALHWRLLAAANPRAEWVIAGDWQQTDRRDQSSSVRNISRSLGVRPEEISIRTLTVNFRSSREVGLRAMELCKRHAPTRTPLPGVWSSGVVQTWQQLAPEPAKLAHVVRPGRDFSIVVPVELRQQCIDAVGEGITVLCALEAKGLEFDEVLLAWPELIAEEGSSQLLVSATRASRALHVISEFPAPDEP